jgi:chemotaxis protein MotB
MGRRNRSSDDKQNTDRWLLTYSDMMNNLLVLFMMLYAMSVIDAQKFKSIAQGLSDVFSQTKIAETSTSMPYEKLPNSNISMTGETQEQDEFDQLYETLKNEVKKNGYEGEVTIEKGDNFVKVRFNDNVLFYPDSAIMKENNTKVIKVIGNILLGIENMIQTIEIGGHTASTGGYTDSFFAWELSSDRAIAVLKYMVQNCQLPESKMSVSGYSKYHPVSSNDTEETRSANRRVEIKITRIEKN